MNISTRTTLEKASKKMTVIRLVFRFLSDDGYQMLFFCFIAWKPLANFQLIPIQIQL